MFQVLFTRVYGFLFNPICVFLLITFLRFCLFGIVECFEFEDRIYVVDRKISPDRYQCWLVHANLISYHLGLSINQIDTAINNASPIGSSMGDVIIAKRTIDQVNWNNLIVGHPELASDGLTCFMTYSTRSLREVIAGRRHPADTVSEFLCTYC
jgi:hypothetical protein